MPDNHYIYVYLDPRKPGSYSYKNHSFGFKPFYVGLGKFKRDISHIKEARDFYSYTPERRKRFNNYKIAILRLLERKGFKPIIIRIQEHMFRTNAINMEIDLIKHWGRKSNGTGFLSNMTPGGEAPNHLMTEERKQKMSKWWKLIDPDGKEFIVHGLTDICEKYGLLHSKLAAVANGKNHRHKGWNCYRIENGKVIIKDKDLISKEEHYGKKFRETVSKALKGKEFSEAHKKALRKPKGPLTKSKAFMNARKITGIKCRGQKRESITRNWEFTSPDRVIYNVRGMKDFCEKFNLIPACISAAVTKKTPYKKWRIKELPANFFETNKISSF